MGKVLQAILTAVLGAAVSLLNNFLEARESDKLKSQIGTLAYENLAIAQEQARTQAAKTTSEVIRRLDDAALAIRMSDTNARVRDALKPKTS